MNPRRESASNGSSVKHFFQKHLHFTYDGYGRVRTVSDPLGYTVTTSYDAADRPTNISYMDGSYQQIVYNYLDPVLQRDRDGHWTSMEYDPLRHLTDIQCVTAGASPNPKKESPFCKY